MKKSLKTQLIYCLWLCCLALPAGASQNIQLAQSVDLFGGDPSTTMRIDILPGYEDNAIGRKTGRRIPVAIMGSPALEVVSINPRTIRLEGVGVLLVGKSDKSLCKQVDLDGDGHLDLHCDVQTTGFRVDPGSYTIRLKAETYNKTTLRGEDRLTIVAN